ncbi:MAG: CoB--CoM heterodisulfide reductase iron-sulfur subunit B family protein [Elusimicrobia bacterium]|nr:CoB--CoM heterodisulfide reductase iron-sulfur subunit B family protein [Elusimicrobiota bacterium]
MNYLYYPGCSLKGTGRAYDESLKAVCRALGITLSEVPDWNCCGATAYMSVEETRAHALAARNLSLADAAAADKGLKRDIIAPCSACYLVLAKTLHALDEQIETRVLVERALKAGGLDMPKAGLQVRHPLDVLVNDVGLAAISAKVKSPLKGLKLAPYYGCQLVRPYAAFDDQAHPVTMDRLMAASGAECVDFPLKTRCCGGSLTGTVPDAGLRLAYIILKEAKKRGAHAVVTVCPLCQFNLDGYQDKIAAEFEEVAMPVLYFTQVLGLALGLSERELGIQRGIVPAEPALAGRR